MFSSVINDMHENPFIKFKILVLGLKSDHQQHLVAIDAYTYTASVVSDKNIKSASSQSEVIIVVMYS